MAWNTGSNSPGDELMTRSTSAVAVCCSSDREIAVPTQFVEQPRVLNGDDGLSGKIFHQFDLLVAERPDFLAVHGERADQFVLPQHWNCKDRPRAAEFDRRNSRFSLRLR